jgi:SAM-dependent methyltransferase
LKPIHIDIIFNQEKPVSVKPHSGQWYDRLSSMQKGYFYPWRSRLEPRHGEDVFGTLVFEHLRPDLDVLEVACAQGELALAIAPRCRSVLGYDRTADYIKMASQTKEERGIDNATFLVHDSSSDANGGRPHMPAADESIDLFVCSKGPFHWIAEAPRVGRPGAVLLMLVPNPTRLTPWTALLPEILRWVDEDENWARSTIEQRLGEAGLRLHSWWSFDVPELFSNPKELYAWRTFGFTAAEVPSYQEVAPLLERIFKEFAGPHGLEVRWRRHIWKAVIRGG